jgi:hypothetical protein
MRINVETKFNFILKTQYHGASRISCNRLHGQLAEKPQYNTSSELQSFSENRHVENSVDPDQSPN